jgi:hypothetical protein
LFQLMAENTFNNFAIIGSSNFLNCFGNILVLKKI